MKNKEQMLKGELYCVDEELAQEMSSCHAKIDELNLTKNLSNQEKEKLYKEIFQKVGKNFLLQPPFYCDYGKHISFGDNVYLNYQCIFLDVAPITIGNNVFFGPRVSLYTAGHPIDKDVRNRYLEFGKPITIGNDVWFGGNVIVNPGVTIGNNVVIGSGSVVVKDIPDNVVCVGNPCRVVRKITQKDKIYWEKEMEKYYRV